MQQLHPRYYTRAQVAIIKKLYANTYTKEIAKIIGKPTQSVYVKAASLGLKKSEKFKAAEKVKQGERLKKTGAASRFVKGLVPKNKGKKMSPEMYKKCKATMFKKKHLPHNTKQVGYEAIRTDKKGRQYYMVKVKNRRTMQLKHALVWKQHNGPIPKGFNVVFKDGNTLNCTIQNLECISNAELMQRNTIHRFPKELKQTIRLVNKLKRKIDAKEQN